MPADRIASRAHVARRAPHERWRVSACVNGARCVADARRLRGLASAWSKSMSRFFLSASLHILMRCSMLRHATSADEIA